MDLPEGFVFDIEADNLYPAVKKVWYVRLTSLCETKTLKVLPFRDPDASQKIQDYLDSFPDGCVVSGHNILQFDVWVLWRNLGLHVAVGKGKTDWLNGKPVQFIDTRYLSMFLNPDMQGHSLGDWGDRLREPKMDYRQHLIDNEIIPEDSPEGFEFSFYHPTMERYCDQDVKVNVKVFKHLWKKATELYKNWIPDSYKVSQKGFFLMGAQEFTGVAFDKELALELEAKIIQMIDDLAKEVEPDLPPRPLKKVEEDFYTMPAKPYKLDGTFSANMLKFIDKHNAEVISNKVIKCYDFEIEISPKKVLPVKLPMELKDQNALKDYFLSLGWKPEFFNIKKDAKGKAMRDEKGKLIETTPKIQDQGKIDPGLLELTGDLPKKIVRFLSLRNRLGVLQGWLNHPRLEIDGRLPGRSSKITNTHRQAHSVVCNVPKAEEGVLFGKEFRSLFKAEDGFMLAAADAVAGENFTEAHYAKPYPGGEEYVQDLLAGDPHLKNAAVFYPEKFIGVDMKTPGLKDDPKVKPLRSKAKSGKYALTFGCSPGKLAKTLGLPETKGKQLYESFWDANIALKALREAVEKYWEGPGNKQHLPGVDGRLLCTRSKHSLLNVLFQSALAITMDYALAIMDTKLGEMFLDDKGRPYYLYNGCIVRRVLYYHDEASYECEEAVAEEICQMLAKAITSASIYVKLRLPIQGEGKFGKNWKETH